MLFKLCNSWRTFRSIFTANECTNPLTAAPFVRICTTGITFATTVVVLLNRLTTTFSGLLTFRLRFLLVVLILCALGVVALVVLCARHQCPSYFAGFLDTHFTYRKRDRAFAAVAMILISAGLAVSATDLKYWKGRSGLLQGQVLDQNDTPISGVQIDAQNIDGVSTCRFVEVTDSYGHFVLEFEPVHGSPANFYLTTSQCRVVTPFTEEALDAIGHQRVNTSDQQWNDQIIVHYFCAPR